jgi:prepilin-type processing-associated H-X9-DG protein
MHFGHYARNDELLHNYGWTGVGSSATDQSNPNMLMSSWERPADVVFYSDVRSGDEDDDTNDYDDDNAPYFEPGGTNWNQIFAQASSRHQEGMNITFLDGHAKWKNTKWLRTPEGKYAICPTRADRADGTGW